MIKYESGIMEVDKAKFLSKRIWVLFWLFVPSVVASIMGSMSSNNFIPVLYIPSEIINVICVIIYGVVLIKISKECKCYKVAGICYLVSGLLSTIDTFLSNGSDEITWTFLITLSAAVVSLFHEYNECKGHAEVLRGVDWELSEKWERIWQWRIGLIIVMFASMIVVMVFYLLGAFILLVALVGSIIVSIVELVYLYRTAKTFGEYAEYKEISNDDWGIVEE